MPGYRKWSSARSGLSADAHEIEQARDPLPWIFRGQQAKRLRGGHHVSPDIDP
jgi:hypothetical protein